MNQHVRTFYEFFAGGGMARAGLGEGWRCLFANDYDHKKSATYRLNWGADELRTADVETLTPAELPGAADLVWASFPCQDLSLAGGGAGLRGERSGTFWPFWKLMMGLVQDVRAPGVIVLENVCGTLTSHGGRDFEAICAALHRGGYRFGALMIDAVLFVPHSRPRLFVVAAHGDLSISGDLEGEASLPWHPATLKRAHARLPGYLQEQWIWWKLPAPPNRSDCFTDVIEEAPRDVEWHTPEQTRRLLELMSEVNRAKVLDAQRTGRRIVGTIYRRTRPNELGARVQRAEVRFDEVAGCLRTPAGGSSRQTILVVHGSTIRSRLISSRETARLMGLPDSYRLPENYNEAYHLTGDGVVVPVVRHVAEYLLEPIICGSDGAERGAA